MLITIQVTFHSDATKAEHGGVWRCTADTESVAGSHVGELAKEIMGDTRAPAWHAIRDSYAIRDSESD